MLAHRFSRRTTATSSLCVVCVCVVCVCVCGGGGLSVCVCCMQVCMCVNKCIVHSNMIKKLILTTVNILCAYIHVAKNRQNISRI